MTGGLSSQEQQWWNLWTNERDGEAANQLVQLYDYLVNYHVHRIAAHLPKNVSKDDVRSLGMLGLYDALKKFDRSRDLKFDTYASFRIRGSIIDGLRKEDWLPRSVRDRAKKIEQVTEQLEQRLQRPVSSKEVAEAAGLTAREVEAAVKDSLFANVLSMEEKPKDSGDDHKEGIGYSIPDEETGSPDASLIRQEDYEELADQIEQLKEKEKLVISLFYKEELTLTEIGHVLNLTTSRISQIHAKAIYKLKQSLQSVL
ncbi:MULTISPECIES: FliA/WhiG family RNA polymerase sigma factor [Halobacillus]|uniref:FliA/WhiG family RNA polymerase sigma factor n=1 Tax=Halobacillus TaxID=45667 RepID=UPI00136DBAD4|nr:MULTISPECIES: FliA/WhiG family RNA polymerase sigma factor [Halobacillus]MYL28361.1 FliA/WhiG family RNA polymerase sigma factor [Halobacillus halophilus]MYL37707.1 FliA/WhiG family RNA polymerase sigma factor [Halobacillus litoralis]